MINRILLITSLLLSSICIGQNINESEITGKWNTITVKIPNEIPQKDAVKFMKDAFTGSIFNFKRNKIFTLKYGENSDNRIKELFKINGENWRIDNNQIQIGTDGNGFSSMHITVQKINGETYFLLPMMRLKMLKINTGEPKPFKKSKNESVNMQTDNTVIIEPKIIELNENEIVTFAIVENPPLAPDCKSKWDIEKQKKCTQNFINNHVMRKFNTGLAAELGIVGRTRIEIQFIVDKNGDVVNITASGAPELMNQNAVDVIAALPKLKPGSQKGEKVNVSYKMPLTFLIE